MHLHVIGMLAAAAFIFMKMNLKKQNSVLRTMQRERPGDTLAGWRAGSVQWLGKDHVAVGSEWSSGSAAGTAGSVRFW